MAEERPRRYDRAMGFRVDRKYFSKNDIIAEINILTIAQEFNIAVEKISSGNFNYRCRCPSKNHKGGSERTGSCYLDSIHNNFHCFGCNASSNCIDFYMLCQDCSFNDAIQALGSRIKEGVHHVTPQNEFNNFHLLLQISNLLRQTILEHRDDLKWINQLMKQIDQETFNLDPKDDLNSKLLLKKVQRTISKRYGA